MTPQLQRIPRPTAAQATAWLETLSRCIDTGTRFVAFGPEVEQLRAAILDYGRLRAKEDGAFGALKGANAPPTQRESEQQLSALSEQFRALMNQHDLGGVVVLVSQDAACWLTTCPSWSGLQPDPVHALRVSISGSDPNSAEKVAATLHLITSTQKTCAKLGDVFGLLWRNAKRALEAQGISIGDEPPTNGVRGRHS